MSTKPKQLLIELIPKTCHFSNVRTTVSAKDWDTIRLISYEAAGHKCEICGDSGLNQGYKHRVECHEIWEYDDEKHVQKLVGLISLCPTCHQVKHFGRAVMIGKKTICIKQMTKVNKWTLARVEQHILESFAVYSERSKHEWLLDISMLAKPPYNIVLKPQKKRIFEVKKYKKKKATKKKTAAKKAAAKKTNKRPKKR